MTDNASIMNVDGASVSEALLAANETRDIFLPNQNEHVAHIAIDVSAIKKKLELMLKYTLDWWLISENRLFHFFSR